MTFSAMNMDAMDGNLNHGGKTVSVDGKDGKDVAGRKKGGEKVGDGGQHLTDSLACFACCSSTGSTSPEH